MNRSELPEDINESQLVEEAGYILSGLTRKIATVDHLLALRNLTAEAYRLIDRAQNADALDESDIRAWKRRAHAILDARVGGRR